MTTNSQQAVTEANRDLLDAAKKVLEGLDARIDAADESEIPVFFGIADLRDAISDAEAALSVQREAPGEAVAEGLELVGWQFNSTGGGWRDCHDEVDARLWLMDGKEIRRIYAAAPEPKP